MLMTWLRQALSWLAVLFSRPSRTAVVPRAKCAHDVDPDVLMRRLLRAVNDPPSFAETLAGFGNCRGCSIGVVAQLVYTLAGLMLDQDQDVDDQAIESCTCDHPAIPEIVAMRLVLSLDAEDDAVLAMTLGQVVNCPSCMLAVLVASTRAQAITLNDVSPAWRPAFERHLLRLLDQTTS